MKNYKYIGILVLAWLFTLPATAQLGEERHNFAVGINGGLNMNSVSFDPKIKQNTLNGMEMGCHHALYVRKILQDDVWSANGNQLLTTRLE